MPLSQSDVGKLELLFNRGGCVLDFSRAGFDAFSRASVGTPICTKYGLPMAQSLNAYVAEAPAEDVTQILCDLFSHYEKNFISEINGTSASYDAGERLRQYEECRPIIERIRGGAALIIQRQELGSHFSSDYMREQIDALFLAREKNPTEAIGKSKELIECCCKTILEGSGTPYEPGSDVSQLVKYTRKCLGIEADDINAELPAGDTIKRILSNLCTVARGIAELRNQYGSGHGRPDSYSGLTVRHAKLAVGSAVTLVEYLWDAYEWRKSSSNV